MSGNAFYSTPHDRNYGVKVGAFGVVRKSKQICG